MINHPEQHGPAADTALRLVFWELTARCNLKCKHCRAEAHDDGAPDELTTAQLTSTATAIRAAGDPIVILTGGEPLARPDFFELAHECCRLFTRTALATNGVLVDDAMAQKIVGCGIARTSVSLDGASPETHDAFRGVPGSFKQALDGILALRRAGMSVQVNTTVARHNMDELDELIALALAAGADAFHLFVLVPVGCGAELPADVRLTGHEIENTLLWLHNRAAELEGDLHVKVTCAPQYHRIMRQNRRPGKPVAATGMHAVTRGCLAGSSVCFVSRSGDVQPCGYLPIAVGNVQSRPFADIWRDSPAFAALRNPAALKGKCGICGFRNVCAGCRARALAESGDFLAEDPDCIYMPETGAAT